MKYYLIVIDSFGIGADSKASQYGDELSNTALNICRKISGDKWDFLRQLGLGNCCQLLGYKLPGCDAVSEPLASYGVLEKIGPGKDTLTGHWELAGLHANIEMKVFPSDYPSFPAELIAELESSTGRKIIGNKAASGTEIIQELGELHLKTGSIICYTSIDSVFQIAAHEDVVSIDELYDICKKARLICDKYNVGRVIARPFTGNKESGFVRTKNRHDYSIELPGQSLLESTLQPMGVEIIAVGKIGDIFNYKGIDINYPEKGNEACFNKIFDIADAPANKPKQLIFANLVDTDMLYGHRRDVTGYFNAITQISLNLKVLYDKLNEGDIINITADHGCDPTYTGTDHTREYVPMLICRKGYSKNSSNLGIIKGFDAAMKDAINSFYLHN